MNFNKNAMHIIWGAALSLMGAVMIFTIPQKMAELEKSLYSSTVQHFARISLYIIALMLVIGGIKKVYSNIRRDGGEKNS